MLNDYPIKDKQIKKKKTNYKFIPNCFTKRGHNDEAFNTSIYF